MDDRIEALLEEPYWVIDVLPERVPADSGGQFFDVEAWMLSGSRAVALRRRWLSLLMKINCYTDLRIRSGDSEADILNPSPDTMEGLVLADRMHLCALLPAYDALITLTAGDLYMTLYNPPESLLHLVRALAASEGLFVWRPNNTLP